MKTFLPIEQQLPQIFTVVLLAIVFNFLLQPLARKNLLIDRPNYRKLHQNNIPLIGGICIFLACGLSLFVFGDLRGQDQRSLIISASLFLILGVLDDQFDLSARVKLPTQITISFFFVASTGLQISSLGNPFGLQYSFEMGFLSLPLTIIAMVGLTNAFNMIDGCDGLAASLSVVSILALLYFGASHFDLLTQNFLLMLVASLFVFLFFNFSNNPAFKSFLGDGGSLFLGFVISVFLVKFAEGNETHRPSMVLWFVAIPVYDFSTVVLRRLLLKRKIMSADRSHLHHYILSFGISHFKTTMIILVAAIALLCLGAFLEANYPSLSLLAFVGLFAAYLSSRLLGHRN